MIKQYPGGRTIITAYPDMSKVIPSKAHLAAKYKFGNAVTYAEEIMGQAEEN